MRLHACDILLWLTLNVHGLELPYPVIGSLNGVHMFANNHDVSLLSSSTDDSKVVWKVFQDNITLIAVSQDDNADDCHLTNLLKYVYQSMVLLCGQDGVQNVDKNVEKFKRDVKVCNHLIDTLIESPAVTSFAELTNTVEIIAASENSVLQNFLDAFTEAAESGYGCLLVDGKIAVATRKWWSLTANELVLLSLLVSTMTKCTSRDLPVFLPDSHPTVPHRLMTFTLTDKVQVCVICGPTPALADLEPEVIRFWRPGYESLRSICRLHPRNFPVNITLDPNLLGFLIINKDNNRCLGSTHPSLEDRSATGSGLNSMQRKEVLHSFYKKIVGTFFTSKIEGSETGPSEFTHQAQETYITTDTHKCYAMQSGSHQIFVLYNDTIPTYAMRQMRTNDCTKCKLGISVTLCDAQTCTDIGLGPLKIKIYYTKDFESTDQRQARSHLTSQIQVLKQVCSETINPRTSDVSADGTCIQ